MLSEIPDDEFAAALDACAAEVLWEAGVLEPPVDCAGRGGRAGAGRRPGFRDAFPRSLRAARCGEQPPCRAAAARSSSARPNGPNASNGPWPTRLARASPIACSSGSALRSTKRCRPPASWSPIAWRTALLLPRRWFAADGRELRLGPVRAEGTLRHGQPRADRAADAGDAAADRDYGLRPGPRPLATQQRDGAPAGIAAGGTRRLAASTRDRLAARWQRSIAETGLRVRPLLADSRTGLEAGDPAQRDRGVLSVRTSDHAALRRLQIDACIDRAMLRSSRPSRR